MSGEHLEEMEFFLTCTGLVLHGLSKTKPEVIFYRHFGSLETVVVSSVYIDSFCTLISRQLFSTLTISLHARPTQTIIQCPLLKDFYRSQCLLQERWKTLFPLD